MSERPVTPDSEYMAKVMAERSGVLPIGIEMMERWNWFERHNALFTELAVMGHLDDGDYKFIIERHGKTFEVSVHELA